MEEIENMLSAQAQEMVDNAINNPQPDSYLQKIWRSWSNNTPMPAEVAVIAVFALRKMEMAKKCKRLVDSEMSANDLADLDNEITYIGSVIQLLHAYLKR